MMKGKVGVSTQIYGTIIPNVRKLTKIARLSEESKTRIKWIDHYLKKAMLDFYEFRVRHIITLPILERLKIIRW